MLYHRRVTAPEYAASAQRHVGWRAAVAILLVLALTGLPSESSRDLALAQDWYFDNLEQPAVVLLGAREVGKAPDRDDAPDGLLPRADVSALVAASLRFSSFAAPGNARPASLLPHSTGPPRA